LLKTGGTLAQTICPGADSFGVDGLALLIVLGLNAPAKKLRRLASDQRLAGVHPVLERPHDAAHRHWCTNLSNAVVRIY
jgi:hypothetical protein